MENVVNRALPLWGFEGAVVTLAAHRENTVYQVTTKQGQSALRLHRTGYRSDAELRSELDWMAAVAAAGISVPSPIPSVEGAYLHRIDGVQVDVLTWLSGDTLAALLPSLTAMRIEEIYFTLGREMARLHKATDAWTPPKDFDRVHWNADGLLGDAPLWDRFWDNPALSPKDRSLFTRFRVQARAQLDAMKGRLDYGLIHADLVPANIMVEGDQLHLIDFDDGGFGYRQFDLATALLKLLDQTNYPAIKTALLSGYQSARSIDLADLDFFLCLRAATYVGWNITRREEPDGQIRNTRFIDTLRSLALDFVD